LAETRRVLRPDGSLRFVEHVRADGAFGKVLDAVTPIWKRVFGGCHPNRRTVEDIRAAGFTAEDLKRDRLAGVLPLVAGVARAPVTADHPPGA
jgi:hypothetical protein